jgi:hypothetical protein
MASSLAKLKIMHVVGNNDDDSDDNEYVLVWQSKIIRSSLG